MSHRFQDRGGATPKYVKMLKQDPCVFCGGIGGTIEHIVPRHSLPVVSVEAEGQSRDHWTNLAASCHGCNKRKGTKSLLVYMLKRNKHV